VCTYPIPHTPYPTPHTPYAIRHSDHAMPPPPPRTPTPPPSNKSPRLIAGPELLRVLGLGVVLLRSPWCTRAFRVCWTFAGITLLLTILSWSIISWFLRMFSSRSLSYEFIGVFSLFDSGLRFFCWRAVAGAHAGPWFLRFLVLNTATMSLKASPLKFSDGSQLSNSGPYPSHVTLYSLL
jgi:hypothetical protein